MSEELAYIIENDLVLHAVHTQLSQKQNVTVIYESKIIDVKLPETSTEFASVQLQSGKQYAAKLLVSIQNKKITKFYIIYDKYIHAYISI